MAVHALMTGVVFRPQSPPELLREAVEAAEAAGVSELWLEPSAGMRGGELVDFIGRSVRDLGGAGATSVVFTPNPHTPDPRQLVRALAVSAAC